MPPPRGPKLGDGQIDRWVGLQTALSTALYLVSKMPIKAIAPGGTRASVVLDLYDAMMDTPSLNFQSAADVFASTTSTVVNAPAAAPH